MNQAGLRHQHQDIIPCLNEIFRHQRVFLFLQDPNHLGQPGAQQGYRARCMGGNKNCIRELQLQLGNISRICLVTMVEYLQIRHHVPPHPCIRTLQGIPRIAVKFLHVNHIQCDIRTADDIPGALCLFTAQLIHIIQSRGINHGYFPRVAKPASSHNRIILGPGCANLDLCLKPVFSYQLIENTCFSAASAAK